MIYSAITGKYDKERTDGVRCFVSYNLFKDERLNAKIYKCLPHIYMPNEEYSVWIDGNLTLKVDDTKLIEMMGDAEVGVFANPYRTKVEEEKKEIIKLGLDTKDNVNRHRLFEGKLPACFLIIRKNTQRVRMANENWWCLITTGSVRDQISFPTAFAGCDVKYFPKVDPFDNEYFTRKGHAKKRV